MGAGSYGFADTLTAEYPLALCALSFLPWQRLVAAPHLWWNPCLGAAGATRSQGLPTERSAENINVLPGKS